MAPEHEIAENVAKLPPKGMWEVLTFKSRGDKRGELIAIQGGMEIPFEIKRVYYMTQTLPDVIRGLHAHRKLDQVLIPVTGSCTLVLNNGYEKQEFQMNDYTMGIRIKDLVWREIHGFTPDCVLLVLASDFYNPSDYIRSFEEFTSIVQGKS